MELIETITTDTISVHFTTYEENVIIRDKSKEICRSYKLPVRIVTGGIGGESWVHAYPYFIINDKMIIVIGSSNNIAVFTLVGDNIIDYYWADDGHSTLNNIVIQPSGIVTDDVIFKYNIDSPCKISFGIGVSRYYRGEPFPIPKFDIYTASIKSIVTTSEEEAIKREIEISIPESVDEYSTSFNVNIPFTASIKGDLQDTLSKYSWVEISKYIEGAIFPSNILAVYKVGEFGYIWGYHEESVDAYHRIGYTLVRNFTEYPRETPIFGILNNHYVFGNMFLRRKAILEPSQSFDFWALR